MKSLIILCAVLAFSLLAIFSLISKFDEKVDKTSHTEKVARTFSTTNWGKPGSTQEALLPKDASDEERQKLQEILSVLNVKNSVRGEAVISFNSEAAYRRFLNKYGASDVLSAIDRLYAARVRVSDLRRLSDLLDDSEGNLGANHFFSIPLGPEGEPPPIQAGAQSFGNQSVNAIGAIGNDGWGDGIMVAVLDTGVEAHSTFTGQIREVDLVGSSLEGDSAGHGTAVASIIAGSEDNTPGVAPSSDILSFRIADADGVSSSFVMADAIFQAVDAGADVINISLGSSSDSVQVAQAVAYATANNVAIVAAAGNEGVNSLSYPARYDDVISVGSVDARGERMSFSNAEEGLDYVAPGFGVAAAYPGEQSILFTGTSASAPFVSGAIAAAMSENASLTPLEAANSIAEFNNEAGAPGVDAEYGTGILNIGRFMERNESGIYDVAVASNFVAPADAEGNQATTMQVVVENRGTETVSNLPLTVRAPAGSQTFSIPSLEPGETSIHDVAISPSRALTQGAEVYTSIVELPNQIDRFEADNTLAIEYSIEAPEQSGGDGNN